MPLRATADSPKARELTKATRQAQSAIRSALKELTVPQRGRVKTSGLISSRPVLSSSDPASGRATSPSITFGVQESGALKTSAVQRTARHEVGHFVTGAPSSAQHLAFKAAGTESSGAGLRRTLAVDRLPSTTKIALALKRLAPRRSGIGGPSGFQTPHLRKVASTGSAAQRTRVKAQMVKLGQKAKKSGVDF